MEFSKNIHIRNYSREVYSLFIVSHRIHKRLLGKIMKGRNNY